MDDEGDHRGVALDGEPERVPGVAAVGAERVEEGLDEDGVLPGGGADPVGEPVVARRDGGLRLEDEEEAGAGGGQRAGHEEPSEQRRALRQQGPRHAHWQRWSCVRGAAGGGGVAGSAPVRGSQPRSGGGGANRDEGGRRTRCGRHHRTPT